MNNAIAITTNHSFVLCFLALWILFDFLVLVGEFKCLSGAVKCIPLTWKCDGENDCRDSSDELSCDTNKCLDTQFSCGPPNNRCIYTTWVCDGDQDCQNGNDEKNCSTTITGKLAISVVTPKLFDQMVSSFYFSDFMYVFFMLTENSLI